MNIGTTIKHDTMQEMRGNRPYEVFHEENKAWSFSSEKLVQKVPCGENGREAQNHRILEKVAPNGKRKRISQEKGSQILSQKQRETQGEFEAMEGEESREVQEDHTRVREIKNDGPTIQACKQHLSEDSFSPEGGHKTEKNRRDYWVPYTVPKGPSGGTV